MNNNYIKVKIEGRNINNYIKWLISKKINIVKMNILNYHELILIIDKKNYNLLNKYSKTYKITILEKYGKLKLFDIIKNNIIILSSIIVAIFFLYFLSKIIFSVDIIYNDQEIIDKLTKEFAKYNIEKYKLKKDYHYLNQVKEKILEDNKDTLEWLEIIENGTKYTVKLVERKQESKKEEYNYQSITAKKDAIITNIKALSGENIKTINQYVKKDEVIISGILKKPDKSTIYTKALGEVYGEVWYKINIEYPFIYQEEKVTGKNKNVLTLQFLNKKIPLFPYKKYKQFKSKTNIILENNLIPLKIIKENLYEVIVKEEIYTEESATQKAIELSKNKLLKSNTNIKEIKNIEILQKQNQNSKIKLELFVSVIENITKIIEIKEENEKNPE